MNAKLNRLLILLLLLAGLIWLPVSPVKAQTPPDADVDFYIKPPADPEKPITVGDRIVLRLEVTHPAGSRVALPQVEREWEAFEVVEQTPPDTVDNGDGTVTTGKDIVVSLFQPGQYQTPALVVNHRKPDGQLEELATPVIPIRVTSVLTEDLELRDLKAQSDIPVPPIWPWVLGGLWLVTAVVLSGTLIGLWYYQRWKKRPLPGLVPVPFIDTRPPEVVAHAELDRIEALNLPAHNRIKEHYSLVSSCLRRYIEGRYRIPALDQTTDELRNAFRRSPVPMKEASSFMSLFTESDLVKFARYQPYTEDINNLVTRARIIVDVTTPEPELVKPVSGPEEVEVAV